MLYGNLCLFPRFYGKKRNTVWTIEILLSLNRCRFQATFRLGNTLQTKNPNSAINHFLKREFPELLECDSDPHQAFLVPDSFIYGEQVRLG